MRQIALRLKNDSSRWLPKTRTHVSYLVLYLPDLTASLPLGPRQEDFLWISG